MTQVRVFTSINKKKGLSMIIRTLTTIAIVTTAIGLVAAQGTGNKPAQQPTKPTTPPAMSPEEKQHMQDAIPGPIHKHMTECVGEYTTKTVMTGIGEPAEATTGTSKLHMSLDGRFLIQEDHGTMMGEPYKTMKISGYNNGSKEFEAVWMYTMSTGMLNMTGSSPDHGRTINWKGAYKDGAGAQTLLVETKHVDANTFIERVMHEGTEQGPVMETTFTRKK